MKKRLRHRRRRRQYRRDSDLTPLHLNAPPEDERAKMRAELQELGLDVSIPITLVAAILVGYMTLGAVLLGKWENWSFFEGFYFSFITMTS